LNEPTGDLPRRGVQKQLIEARRQLKQQENRLAQLTYEWNIAKRLRNQAHSEEEREKWHVQSDAYMGLVMQQESDIEEMMARIDRYQLELAELDTAIPGGAGDNADGTAGSGRI
jgi:hypothetical protein